MLAQQLGRLLDCTLDLRLGLLEGFRVLNLIRDEFLFVKYLSLDTLTMS